MDTTGLGARRFQYYGLIEHGGRIAEVLVTREGGRQIGQDLTGVTYPATRAGQRRAGSDNAAKNAAVAEALRAGR